MKSYPGIVHGEINSFSDISLSAFSEFRINSLSLNSLIKSLCKNEGSNRERINAMEKCFDEILLNYAEEEYQHENNVIH